MSDEKKPVPFFSPKPTVSSAGVESEWRVELLNSPLGSTGRRHRTQRAATAAQAWEKFKAACVAELAETKTQGAQNLLKTVEVWLAHAANDPAYQHNAGPKARLRIVPESQAVSELNASRVSGPTSGAALEMTRGVS